MQEKSELMKIPTKYYVIFLIFIFAIGIGNNFRKKKLLEECSKVIEAEVVDKHRMNSKIPSAKFEFKFEGNVYKVNHSITNDSIFENLLIGDSVELKISCSSPDVSKLITK